MNFVYSLWKPEKFGPVRADRLLKLLRPKGFVYGGKYGGQYRRQTPGSKLWQEIHLQPRGRQLAVRLSLSRLQGWANFGKPLNGSWAAPAEIRNAAEARVAEEAIAELAPDILDRWEAEEGEEIVRKTEHQWVKSELYFPSALEFIEAGRAYPGDFSKEILEAAFEGARPPWITEITQLWHINQFAAAIVLENRDVVEPDHPDFEEAPKLGASGWASRIAFLRTRMMYDEQSRFDDLLSKLWQKGLEDEDEWLARN